MLVLGISFAEFPKNRGDITVEEFAENYNRYMDYMEFASEYKLNSAGEWDKKTNQEGMYVYFDEEVPRPKFTYIVENGYMAGLSFEQELGNRDVLLSTYVNERILAVMAFILAQENIALDKAQVKQLVNEINQCLFQSFYYEVYGVKVCCAVIYEGYDGVETQGLLSQEGEDTKFAITFSIQK